MNRSRELDPAECHQRLESQSGGVGRLALMTPNGPMIYPVNFAVDGNAVVFRTSAHSTLGSSIRGIDVAFEVDHVDLATRQGWSVVVKGRAHIVDDPEDEDRLRSLGREPVPWVSGLRRTYVRIPCREISGRVVGADLLASPRPLVHSWFGY
jgi:nitroimidazol reductase NimA-like FMN-containing flavoprotein (pyridoxamine 5'-phosphate oxidase superfamily)